MIKINLLKQRSRTFLKAERIKRINTFMVLGGVLIFVLTLLYMSTVFVYQKFRANELTKELGSLDRTYNSRASEVVTYVRVKQLVTNVISIQARRFRYKDYLLAIYKLLPSTAKLSSVDFSEEGVISFGARVDSFNDYDYLINKIGVDSKDKSFLFKNIALKALTKDKSGSIIINLEARIK